MRKCSLVAVVLVLVAGVHAQANGPTRAMRIQDLTISGATHVPPGELNRIQSEIKAQCCNSAETQEMRKRIVYAFQKRGYFKARVESMDVKSVETRVAPPAVDAAVALSDGQQYRLKAIQFNGNKAVASEQLRQQFPIQDGEVFNVDKIRSGLEDLRKLYVTYGYVNMAPVPNAEADDAFAFITLTIDVDEGKQFRLGGLLLDGEEPHAGDGAKLLAAWKPMEGQPYNGQKIEQWWQLALTMLPPGAKLEQMLVLKQDAASGIVMGLLNLPSAK